MSLSDKDKKRMRVAMGSKAIGDEVSAAIDAFGSGPAANVADISSSDLVGVDGTGSNAAPLAGTETRLDAIEVKINQILASLRAAGMMV